MSDFRPATAPPGRLVRLGLVLDPRNSPKDTMRIAQMAERAGLQSLWVNDRMVAQDGGRIMEAWTLLTIASLYTSRIRVGAMFVAGLRTPQAVAAMVGSMDTVVEGRLEIGVATGWSDREFKALGIRFPDAAARIADMGRFAGTLRSMTRGEPINETGVTLAVNSPQTDGPPLTMEARGQRQIALGVRLADSLLLPSKPISEIASIIEQARQASEQSGRDPRTLGFAVQLPVSVGRTNAESDVRVEIDHLMAQMNTQSIGVHGDLERCQDIMIELAHLGIGEVRCVLPNVPDIDDVIAQLTATAVGTTEVLKPGQPKSEAPAPPPGWGGPMKAKEHA